MRGPLADALIRLDADLRAIRARWALVGGLAVSARAEPRTTRDIDVAIALAGYTIGEAEGREVGRWTQPLLEPHDVHTAVFLTKDIGGVLHVLLATRAEPGLADMVEFGPTVRLRSPEEDPGLPEGFA